MAGTIAALADQHEIGVVYLRGPGEGGIGSLAECCALVEPVDRSFPMKGAGRWLRKCRLAAGLAGGTPLWPGRWWTPACDRALRRVVRTWRPDVVQFEYHVMGQYAAAAGGGTGRVLVDHDPGESAARDARTAARGARAMTARADLVAWRRYQRRVMRAVDRVVVFTDRDRSALLPYAGSTPVVRIPFGVDVPVRASNPVGDEPDLLLFIGSFRHFPNEDAARQLLHEIFPAVRKRHPAARLAIVGSDAPAWLLEENGEAVEFAGDVDDLGPYFDRAAIMVLPIRLGGGLRVKTLEALAAGKAIVASPKAAEGLNVQDDEHLKLARTADEFVADIVDLLNSVERRRAMAVAARQWASTHADWKDTAAAYAALYNALLSDGVREHVHWSTGTGAPVR